MQNKLILATDLDGTFLAGDENTKNKFYQFLRQNKDQITVIFVTGRTIGLINKLYDNGFNFIPDYIIADHGSIIITGDKHEYVEPLQTQIINKWQQSKHNELEVLLANQPVEKQPFNPPFRHAYYYESTLLNELFITNEINKLGFECILSHNVYMDILPYSIGKGQSLKALVNHLGANLDDVIACGDSLNDLTLFETGCKSIAVGNSETALVSKIMTMDNVYHSHLPGVDAIVDGLKHFCNIYA